MVWLLRSPLHRLSGKHLLLMTLVGRTSGKCYTFPVSYIRDGETLVVISQRDRNWWRNLRDGAPITLTLNGREVRANGEAFTETVAVMRDLLCCLQLVPAYQRFLHIKLNAAGLPDLLDPFAQLAQNRVSVRITLEPLTAEQDGDETRPLIASGHLSS